MKRVLSIVSCAFIFLLYFVCYAPVAHAKTYRIALIHSFEQEYNTGEISHELLKKELRANGLRSDIREYFLDCERYDEAKENVRMGDILDDLAAWGADLIAVLDDQATYALMACKHPLAREYPVMFSGVNYPNERLLQQYPNVTGYADVPDYLHTIRMIERIRGKSRVCLMNGYTFLDNKIWDTLSRQCQGEGFGFAFAYHDDYTAEYRQTYWDRSSHSILKGKRTVADIDSTSIVRMMGDSVAIHHVIFLGCGAHSVFLYTKRDYTTTHIATLFVNPTFGVINAGFGVEDFFLGGYFTPLESQMKYMAAGIKERLSGRMPQQQTTYCKKQYVLNWRVLQRYHIPLEQIPPEYTIMYVPFVERYHYLILYGSILGGAVILFLLIFLAYSFRRERRRKREALRNLRYEHETFSLATEGNSTYTWRLEGDAIFCDSQFYDLLNHPHTLLRIEEVAAYVHPDDYETFMLNASKISERSRHKGQYRCRFNGEYEWWEFSYNTLYSSVHVPVIAGLLHNIQHLKDREAELIQARKLAEQAELKQSFLNNMSHEIRTPLNAIAGFSNMLVCAPDLSDEEKQEYVDIINTNTQLLLNLIDDVLELSRIESGHLSFKIQRESVRKLLNDVYQTHSVLIHPPLAFIKSFPIGEEDTFINVDSMRLMQVLTNFLNNANKFTESGYIKLGYYCSSENGKEVHLYVEDTGVGIPQSEQKMVFERFYKRNEFSQGVGLGLSICTLIVEKMGGRIELQSEKGEGSCFTIVLPSVE